MTSSNMPSNLPSPDQQPQSQYNITGFQPPAQLPSGGSGNLADALFATFMKVLDDFKANMANNNQQLQLIQKITIDLNSLMSLFTVITSPGTPPSDTGQQITSTLNDLQTNIGQIPDSSAIKALLQQQLSTISALMTSNPFIQLCKKIITDINNLTNDWTQLAQSGVNIKTLAAQMSTDIGQFQTDYTNLTNFVFTYGSNNPPPPQVLLQVQSAVSTAWIDLINVEAVESGKTGVKIITIDQAWPNGTTNMTWQNYVAALNTGLVGGSSTWTVDGLYTYQTAALTAVTEAAVGEQWQGMTTQALVTMLNEMAQPVSGENLRNSMGFLWNQYTSSQSSLDQMLSASGSFTNQQITTLSQSFAAMQSVVQELSQQEAQLANEVTQEVRRTSPFYH